MEPAVLERLHVDHRRLTRVLDALEFLIDRYQGARGFDLDALASLVDYVGEYPDAVHHPLEDRVFAQLARKPLTEEQVRVVENNVAQHAALSSATRTLARDIDSVLNGSAATMAQLRHDVQDYVALQRRHLQNEEALLFPLALRVFTDEDWNALEEAELGRRDPLFEERLTRYRDIYDYVAEDLGRERPRPGPHGI